MVIVQGARRGTMVRGHVVSPKSMPNREVNDVNRHETLQLFSRSSTDQFHCQKVLDWPSLEECSASFFSHAMQQQYLINLEVKLYEIMNLRPK